MNLLLSKIFTILLKFINFCNYFLKNISLYLSAIKIYLDKNECNKFSDCLLLAKLKASQPPASDRYIEYPWMVDNIAIKQGKLLDVGSTACEMLFSLLPASIEIHGINLNDKIVNNKNIKFSVGDIKKTDYSDNFFDCITCISTLEHIGVYGRYNSDNDPEGDIKAMAEMNRILKHGGEILITVPYGIRDVLPINKLYNKNRLDNLLKNFKINSQIYIKFSKRWGVWLKVNETEAAQTDMIKDDWYALTLIKATKD